MPRTRLEELHNLYLVWYLIEFVLDFVWLFGGFFLFRRGKALKVKIKK